MQKNKPRFVLFPDRILDSGEAGSLGRKFDFDLVSTQIGGNYRSWELKRDTAIMQYTARRQRVALRSQALSL